MTESDRKKLTQILIELDAGSRLKDLQEKFPDGLMTKTDICDYCGRYNQTRWGNAFVKNMTAYTDGHSPYRKYRIADVVAKLITYEKYEDVYGKEE